MTGCEILATDGSIGTVDDFIVDDATFAIGFPSECRAAAGSRG
jgi:hypothetical protein